MTRYIWHKAKGEFLDPETFYTLKAQERVNYASDLACPHIMGDIEYISPLTGKPITSRSERREELKRNNMREVDPSEFKPQYQNAKYERRYSKRAQELARR